MAEGDVAQAPASVEVVVYPLEAVRLQAEEHPMVDAKVPETLSEKCLHLIHLKAYDTANTYTGGRDVLDVGCNTGYGTQRLVGAARSVTGVDVSPEAVDAARSRPGGGAVDYRVIDGTRLPFDDATMDLVTSFQVIEHVADPMPYLAEIKRVLRPGGIALFTTPNAAIRLDPGMTPWNRFHVREYSGAELSNLLTTVFDDVEVVGMFGVPTLYDLEIARVGHSRNHQRRLPSWYKELPLGLFTDEEALPPTSPDGAAPAQASSSDPAEPSAATEPAPPDEDPDLRLQPHAAAERPGPGPGPGGDAGGLG